MNVQDRRRLLGPANAKSIVFTNTTKEEATQKKAENDNEAIFLQTGLIENCNGSSLVEFKGQEHQTSLITSVYGPRALRGSFTSKASLSVQIENGSFGNYEKSNLKELATFLTNVFSSVINRARYPKSGIDIFIHLTYDKNLKNTNRANIAAIIPHCITSITLALVDAGIEIIDMTSGGYHNGNVFAFIKNGEEVTGFWKDEGSEDDIQECLQRCKDKYLHYKGLMMGYLSERQKTKFNEST